MPFLSKSQARKFRADPKLRPMAKEWADATPNIAQLPERVAPKRKKKKKPGDAAEAKKRIAYGTSQLALRKLHAALSKGK